jgi:hypothetical protein
LQGERRRSTRFSPSARLSRSTQVMRNARLLIIEVAFFDERVSVESV